MDRELLQEAELARENAIAPFSRFRVGAALRTRDGRIYRGCNVENASFGLTVCAERVALLSALAAGVREFTEIAVATQSDVPSTPCGPCRQLMWEYCGDIDIGVVSTTTGAQNFYRLSELFPEPFELSPEE
jgi:cytidine deaminase